MERPFVWSYAIALPSVIAPPSVGGITGSAFLALCLPPCTSSSPDAG
jgi:hypothetical protein